MKSEERRMKRYAFILLIGVLGIGVYAKDAKREMRCTWIATVANIDWPSPEAVGHSDMQKQEMLFLLDSLQHLRFNAVVFQIRPTADAFYVSEMEPLSSWLTGRQGQDNDEPYDPLAFVTEEAHKRCLDVHVWLNPYRMTHTFGLEDLDSLHIYRQHPEWFWQYGDKWYFDPGLDETRRWLNNVVGDVVSRYDIDAIHFDDYFYPYKIRAQSPERRAVSPWEDFPDDSTFVHHSRGFADKDAWRRNNVDMVIEELQQTIKRIKPWVEFGISPFGVWRNQRSDPERGSKTQAGVQNYDDLYADILLWLEKGWIDYVVPQLYWEIGKRVADYEILVHWWAENSYGKNLYIGHFASQLEHPRAAKAWQTPNEICRQLRMNQQVPEVDGSVMYSCAPMLRNPQGICDSLASVYYRYPALPPINRNIECALSMPPQNLTIDGHRLHWENASDTLPAGLAASRYVVYAFPLEVKPDFDDPQYILGITADTEFEVDEPDRYETICVTSVNHYKQESLPCILKR